MLKYTFIFILITLCNSSIAQESDTLNRIDSIGKKQGYWILLGKHKTHLCYSAEQKIEEGRYLNNKKTGLWKEYYCNGNAKNELNFLNGRPNGHAKMFYENGALLEEGTWKINRWVGQWTMYKGNGEIETSFFFDSTGKRPGKSICNMDLLDIPKKKKCYKKEQLFIGGSYVQVEIEVDCVVEKETKNPKAPLVLNGKKTLYNKNKQITKDGIFKDNRLMEGKAYVYDENGVLTRVAVYKEGIYVGDAPIEN